MKAADTSVVVAAFASWHEDHDRARAALDAGLALPGHAALESYSVLTRLPPPHRAAAAVVRDFLVQRFPEPFLTLAGAEIRALVGELESVGITGGATYDAVVAATARSAGATLVSFDRRALPTYARMGLDVEFL